MHCVHATFAAGRGRPGVTAQSLEQTTFFQMRGKTILRIDVRTKALEETTNGVRGVATVTFGNSFAVRNISIVESKAGNLFMSMPSYKMKTVDENGKPQFKDIAYPVTKAFREKLQEKILQSYESGEDSCFEV